MRRTVPDLTETLEGLLELVLIGAPRETSDEKARGVDVLGEAPDGHHLGNRRRALAGDEEGGSGARGEAHTVHFAEGCGGDGAR